MRHVEESKGCYPGCGNQMEKNMDNQMETGAYVSLTSG